MKHSTRDLNFELMRFIFMFLICLVHANGYVPSRWCDPLTNISFVGVIGFVLISGYFGIRFSYMKALKIEGVGLGCALTVVATAWLCGATFTPTSAAWEVIRLFKNYWFIHAYVVMMALAHLLPDSSAAQGNNILSSSVDAESFPRQKEDGSLLTRRGRDSASTGKDKSTATLPSTATATSYRHLPYLLLIYGWSFAMLIPGVQKFIPRTPGLEPFSGLTLFAAYLVGRLYRAYDLDHRLTWKVVLPTTIVALSVAATCGPFRSFAGAFARYNSPFLVISAIGIFWMLRKVPAASRLASLFTLLTPSVLSVYLLHCNEWGYKVFAKVDASLLEGLPTIVSALILAALVFVGGFMLDLPRRFMVWIGTKLQSLFVRLV